MFKGTLDFIMKSLGMPATTVPEPCYEHSANFMSAIKEVMIRLGLDDISNALLVCKAWHACIIDPDVTRCIKNKHSGSKNIRGPYIVHTPQTKSLFRKLVLSIGKEKAKKLPAFKAVPRRTIDGWADDMSPLPVGGHLRRSGGGKKKAFNANELSKLFKEIDKYKHQKQVTYLDFSEIAVSVLGPPSTVTYPKFKFSEQWAADTVKANDYSLQEISISDENKKKSLTPMERMGLFLGFLEDVYSFRDFFRIHFCHGDYLQEQISSLPRIYNFDEISEEREPPPRKAGKSITKKGSERPMLAGQGTFHEAQTVGLTSRANGQMEIPMVIFSGMMQPLRTIQEVVIKTLDNKDKKVKVFVAHTSTHKNNQFVYKEYLKSCILPGMAKHDCTCGDPRCKSILFIDDRCRLHQAPVVRKLWAGLEVKHVAELSVPEKLTPNAQPNVRTFIHIV